MFGLGRIWACISKIWLSLNATQPNPSGPWTPLIIKPAHIKPSYTYVCVIYRIIYITRLHYILHLDWSFICASRGHSLDRSHCMKNKFTDKSFLIVCFKHIYFNPTVNCFLWIVSQACYTTACGQQQLINSLIIYIYILTW